MPTETESAPNAIALLSAPQTAHFAFSEPLVAPLSPAAALERLLEIEGVLARNAELVQVLATPQIGEMREEMMQAIGSNDSAFIAGIWGKAQQMLGELYASTCSSAEAVRALNGFNLLNWPDPNREEGSVQPVDISTIIVTHTRPVKQVHTYFSFARAPGATGYWLHEIRRTVLGEDYEDATLSSNQPCFTRVRMGAGVRRFRIESRNPHSIAFSDVFDVEIPAP